MSSFYGNIKSIIRSPFVFDKIYPNRKEMEDSLLHTDENGKIIGDGIFINRYVLINYGFNANQDIYIEIADNEVSKNPDSTSNETNYLVHSGNYTNYFIKNANDKFVKPTSWDITKTYYYQSSYTPKWKENLSEGNNNITDYYTENRQIDIDRYHANYDLTVWMKIYTNNQEEYICVAHLEPATPGIQAEVSAPIDDDFGGSNFFDQENSSSEFYVYNIAKNWNLYLNDYNPTSEEHTTLLNNELNLKNYPSSFNSTYVTRRK